MKGTAWRIDLGIGAIATGIRWHRPARRLPWWLIAAAQGLFVERLHGSDIE